MKKIVKEIKEGELIWQTREDGEVTVVSDDLEALVELAGADKCVRGSTPHSMALGYATPEGISFGGCAPDNFVQVLKDGRYLWRPSYAADVRHPILQVSSRVPKNVRERIKEIRRKQR